MKRIVVFGTQWGDEGKGKITNYFSTNADVVVRYQGGANAGHTVIVEGVKHSLHLLPSGIIEENIINIMANGMVIDPEIFYSELELIQNKFKLYISNRATIVLPIHKIIDKLKDEQKGDNKIGTTGRGIGPAYSDKLNRINLKVSEFVALDTLKERLEIFLNNKKDELKQLNINITTEQLYNDVIKYAKYMQPFVTDTSLLLDKLIKNNSKIIFEGAQGAMLDIEHGTYPFVTSSSPVASSVPINTGIAPWLIDGAVGIVKAYTTRVGAGPFVTEIEETNPTLAEHIRTLGHEFGVTTGRARRIGWLDTFVINHVKRVSGMSYIAVTLLDVLSGIKTLNICTGYKVKDKLLEGFPATILELQQAEPVYIELPGWEEDITNVKSFEELPINAQNYLNKIVELTDTPLLLFSVGPDRKQTVTLKDIYND
jgi:adenylosuccinate synthase